MWLSRMGDLWKWWKPKRWTNSWRILPLLKHPLPFGFTSFTICLPPCLPTFDLQALWPPVTTTKSVSIVWFMNLTHVAFSIAFIAELIVAAWAGAGNLNKILKLNQINLSLITLTDNSSVNNHRNSRIWPPIPLMNHAIVPFGSRQSNWNFNFHFICFCQTVNQNWLFRGFNVLFNNFVHLMLLWAQRQWTNLPLNKSRD